MELYRGLVLSRQIDGLILFAIRQHDPRISFLEQEGFPFVVFGRTDISDGSNWIDVDGTYGIEVAVTHLGELGHRRIAYLSPPTEQFLEVQRWQGFVTGMEKIGAEIDMELVRESDFTEYSGEMVVDELLDLEPTAIICNNDRTAFGAMRAIQQRGLVVGQDVSVTGFDDISLARYWQPSLTTIRQPIREIGQQLFYLLQAMINGDPIQEIGAQLLKPELCIRNSTGKRR
jgi:DNA-binding LacI/PurR family transcriptional regulator